MSPFAIFALPRSRTAWVSRFLTSGPWVCVHDAMTQIGTVRHLRDILEIPHTGIVETGLAFGWPVVRRYFPDCRFAVIRRPVGEVEASLARFGIGFVEGHLGRMEEDLNRIAALPGTVSVTFDELRTREACRRLFEHCTGEPFDAARWERMAEVNIQIDIPERLRGLVENAARYEGLVAEVRSLMAPCTFEAERWATFHPDCVPLMEKHAAEIGPAHPGMPFDPHLEMAEALDRDERIVFMTARAAGRMVGYCVFVIAPSFESRNVLCGTQGIFFVLPEFRGHGPELLRAAIDEMRRRGVGMLYLRHGLRGSSAKLGSLFRRLGAQDNGHDYTLWIGADNA